MENSFKNIIERIEFKQPLLIYVLLIIIFTLAIRLILCLFKTVAINNGEVVEKDDEKNGRVKWHEKDFGEVFWVSFCSCSKDKDIKIKDYWLPAMIGIFELSIFPIIMTQGLWIFIGAWIGIKTASSWGGWQKTRTAYNRFLLGNILSLGFSALIAWVCF